MSQEFAIQKLQCCMTVSLLKLLLSILGNLIIHSSEFSGLRAFRSSSAHPIRPSRQYSRLCSKRKLFVQGDLIVSEANKEPKAGKHLIQCNPREISRMEDAEVNSPPAISTLRLLIFILRKLFPRANFFAH